jgi:hypothetical protein
MRTAIHPALFLAISIAVSATVLWLRSSGDPASAAPRENAQTPTPRAAARKSVRLDAATLQRHAGRYDLAGTIVEIVVDNGALVADGGSMGRYHLLAASETEFFVAESPGEVTFSGDDGGRSARFVVDLASGRWTAARVADR